MHVGIFGFPKDRLALRVGTGAIVCTRRELDAIRSALSGPSSVPELDLMLKQASYQDAEGAYKVSIEHGHATPDDLERILDFSRYEIVTYAMELGENVNLWRLNFGEPIYALGTNQGFLVLAFEELKRLAEALPRLLEPLSS